MFVRIPKGEMDWDGPVNDAMEDLQDQITHAQTLLSSEHVNVLDRGVKGDGATDDLAAIQAVLDEVATAGGGVVFFPPGRTYCVSDYLQVTTGTIIMAYGATIKGTANRGLVKLYRNTDTTFTAYNGHSRIRIFGGVWDVNAADAGTGTVTAVVDGFLMSHNNDVHYQDVTVRNVSGGHAIDMVGSQNVRIINCRFEGFKDNTVDQSSSFREAIQLDFAISGSGSNGAMDGTPCRNVRIQGCYFGASSRLGGFGRAVGSHTSYNATTFAENIQILDCRIETTLQEGIRAYAWRKAVISNNLVSGTGSAGIIVTGPDPAAAGYTIACQDICVRGNILDTAGASSPLRVIGFATARPSDVRFVNNTVTGSASTGIYVSQADAPEIVRNRVRGCASSSVYAINCIAPTISGNQVSGSGGASIGADACTGGHVSNNIVNGSNGHGILVNGGTDVSVTGNRVVGVESSGIRATTSAARARILNNVVLRNGAATDYGIDVTASATDCLIIGNDLSGSAWPTDTAYRLLGTRQVLDWSGGSVAPGQNLFS